MFNCIIVGAGPAGATTAYHLAKQGHSVLVLEKADLPRYRPGGGGISPMVKQWLNIDFSPVIAAQVSQVRYTWKMGDPVQANLQSTEPMWMVKRDQFDHFLVQQAQQQGANIQTEEAVTGIEKKGDHWQVTTAKGSYESQYLVAADGANGVTAAALGLKAGKPTLGVVLEVKTAVAPNHANTALFDFGTIKNGYIWCFPKGDGYSISAGIFRGDKGKAEQLHKQLLDYSKENGIDTRNSQFYETSLNLWSENSPLHTSQGLVVGEAAGMVDPLLGEGVRPAIYTGWKAAEAVNAALSGNESALAEYSQEIHDTFGNDFALASRLAGLFYQFPKIAYKVALKRPAAAKIMSKILCGESSYSEVTDKAIQAIKKNLIPGMKG